MGSQMHAINKTIIGRRGTWSPKMGRVKVVRRMPRRACRPISSALDRMSCAAPSKSKTSTARPSLRHRAHSCIPIVLQICHPCLRWHMGCDDIAGLSMTSECACVCVRSRSLPPGGLQSGVAKPGGNTRRGAGGRRAGLYCRTIVVRGGVLRVPMSRPGQHDLKVA